MLMLQSYFVCIIWSGYTFTDGFARYTITSMNVSESVSKDSIDVSESVSRDSRVQVSSVLNDKLTSPPWH